MCEMGHRFHSQCLQVKAQTFGSQCDKTDILECTEKAHIFAALSSERNFSSEVF